MGRGSIGGVWSELPSSPRPEAVYAGGIIQLTPGSLKE